MAIGKGQRFPINFNDAFGSGLVLVGEITEDRAYVQGRNRDGSPMEGPQLTDEVTGLRQWKASVMDPGETKAKRASFDLVFLSAVRPVPAGTELMPGMRRVELDGLEVEPKVMGQGEFKYLGYKFFARGVVGDTSGARGSAAGAAAGAKSAAGKSAA